ncbi:MAG: cobalamin biosynthesis protein CbiL, partial [Gammaproteobacteria bacterium]|nr:cobalamin biosynthesis protein CbiL [Gammaproteobacteria bacterium]
MVFSGSALAHKVNMFANVEGGRIVVEGYFADGKKAKDATIQVFAPDGTKLLQGKADGEGIFSFDVPQVTDLRISLYAGMGHRTEYTVPAAELQGAAGAAGSATAGDGMAGDGMETPTASSPAATSAAVDPAEIRAIVQQAVGESLT